MTIKCISEEISNFFDWHYIMTLWKKHITDLWHFALSCHWSWIIGCWIFRTLGVVSQKFCKLSKIMSQKYNARNHLFLWEFQVETLYVCPKPCFGHTCKVKAWSSHKKYNICSTQISRSFWNSRNVSETTPWPFVSGCTITQCRWNPAVLVALHHVWERKNLNRPLSQLFFLYRWAAEKRILPQSEQPTAGCIVIFHKYVCYKKHVGIMTNLNLWNPWGCVTDMSKCHGMGVWAWIRIYYVLCSKTYQCQGGLVLAPRWFETGR